MKALISVVAVCAAAGLGMVAMLENRRAAEENRRAEALSAVVRRAEVRLAELERGLASRDAALDRLRNQPFRITSAGARVQIECDEPMVLRQPLSPEIDKENPRIGTLIRLVRRTGEEIVFANADLSVTYEDLGNRNRRFTFDYQPIDRSPLIGQYLPSLSDIEALVVSYGPVMNALGFCWSQTNVSSFQFTINDLVLVSLANLGPFGKEPTRYPVGTAFKAIESTYTSAVGH